MVQFIWKGFISLPLSPFVIIAKNLVNLLLKLSQNHSFFLFSISPFVFPFSPPDLFLLARATGCFGGGLGLGGLVGSGGGSGLTWYKNQIIPKLKRERKLRTLARLLPLSFDPGTKAWLLRRLGWFKALALHCPGAWAWSTNHLMQASLDARCVATSNQHLSSKAWLMWLDRWVSRWNMKSWM